MAQEPVKQTAGRDQFGDFAPPNSLNSTTTSSSAKSGASPINSACATSASPPSPPSSAWPLPTARRATTSTKPRKTASPAAKLPKSSPPSPSTPLGLRFRQVKDIWAEDVKGQGAKADFESSKIFSIGEPNTAYERYFTGKSHLAAVPQSKFASPTSSSNLAAATSGTFTMPLPAAGKSSSTSRPASSSGTELRPTAGQPIRSSKLTATNAAMNGSNLSAISSRIVCHSTIGNAAPADYTQRRSSRICRLSIPTFFTLRHHQVQ